MQLAHSVKMMGTTIDLMVDSSTPQVHIDHCCQLLEIYRNRFSANDADSELMQINNQAGISPVKVHPDLFDLISLGKKHSLASPSNLNIALGPLVQSWRIGFVDARVPEHKTIESALALTNPENIILDKDTTSVFLSQKGMKIDLGALAKGYIADKIMNYLKNEKVSSAMINLGGNVLVHGENPNRENGTWVIGIQHPQKTRGNNLGAVTIRNQSVVTSGIYERHLNLDGKDYHHIFDRQTGYPIDSPMASLTIVSDLSVDCEIWTTRLFGLPLMEAIMTINHLPHVEGIIITRDNRIAVSDGLKKDFQLFYS
ncbi:FAD:protein FMN transferase [Streptococcus henryi]|uniref:FAD:protein FMN transferase n=1 Tax=Streptococcus henryi TaxID=439219 RepID=UPI000375DD79|nr:FAD:protein FMN transferase [Streptococcus henryi]